MTVEQFIYDYLFGFGIHDKDVKAIIEEAKKSELLNDLHWSDPKEGYPDFLFPTVILTIREIALKYIDEHMPKAWFRPFLRVDMEYIDYCPNCDQQLTIVELPGNYVFKHNGSAVRKCPGCKMKLEIVNGEISVISEDDDEG